MKYRLHLRLARMLSTLVTVSALGAVVGANPARAQNDPTVEIARQRFREGVEFYDQREYEKARLAFLQAYALKPHPSVLLNLAQSELRAGYPADAANHFAAYLRENPNATTAEKQEVELGFAAAKSKSGAVEVAVDVEGADILVDNDKKGRSPMADPIYVTPGRHTIVAQSGNDRATTTVTVATGDSVGATLRLRSSAAAAAPASEEVAPPEPPRGAEEEAGVGADELVVTSERKSFFEWYGGQPIAWVGTGLAGIGLIGGGVFAFLARNSYANAEDTRDLIVEQKEQDGFTDPPCDLSRTTRNQLGTFRAADYDEACSQYDDKVKEGDDQKLIATVGLIAGGALAVGTLALYFIDPSAEEEARAYPSRGMRARVAPVVEPTYQGFTVLGTF